MLPFEDKFISRFYYFHPSPLNWVNRLLAKRITMEQQEKMIQVYDKREKVTSNFYVIDLGENSFRMAENDILNCQLTFGTEFLTRINEEGKHEIIRILKDSPYLTRRFFLSGQFTEQEYRLLGDEIVKNGGFWQVDFGGIATINLPRENTLDIDRIFKLFNFSPTEIRSDNS